MTKATGTVDIYRSDGSDGYTRGTWGCVVTVVNRDGVACLSRLGGWESAALARQAGRETLVRMEAGIDPEGAA